MSPWSRMIFWWRILATMMCCTVYFFRSRNYHHSRTYSVKSFVELYKQQAPFFMKLFVTKGVDKSLLRHKNLTFFLSQQFDVFQPCYRSIFINCFVYQQCQKSLTQLHRSPSVHLIICRKQFILGLIANIRQDELG